jgi:23S rRNA pseudouridine1911/1915/1917 synthase
MPRTLLDYLIQRFPTAKRQTLRQMVQSGRVRVDGKVARTVKDAVEEKQKITVDDHATKSASPRRIAPPLPIVFEDEDLLVIDKPAGLLTSTVPREPRKTAVAVLREYLAQTDPDARLGLIHRLDRDASGLLVFSKNHEAYRALKEQFFRHTVDRIYLAAVHGKLNPDRGRIKSRLVELPDGSVRSTQRPDAGELAISEYEVIQTAGDLQLVRVTLFTGRKHQIRVHLSERNAPILGDRMYSPKDSPAAPRLMLAAVELGLVHPQTKKGMRWTIPPPPAMRRLFRD